MLSSPYQQTIPAAAQPKVPQRLNFQPSPAKRNHAAGQHDQGPACDQQAQSREEVAHGLAAADSALSASMRFADTLVVFSNLTVQRQPLGGRMRTCGNEAVSRICCRVTGMGPMVSPC